MLACRSVEKGQAAAREIAERTKNDNVMVKHLDLADLSSVKRFVDEVQRQNLEVNVLVNNAGAMNPELSLVHGIERTFFVNHLYAPAPDMHVATCLSSALLLTSDALGHRARSGPFYLTNLLLPNLKAASEASGVESRMCVAAEACLCACM